MPHDISERLRVAREQAVQRARQLRLAAPARRRPRQVAQGSITLGQPTLWWLRLASVLPLVLLVLGLVLDPAPARSGRYPRRCGSGCRLVGR